MGSQLVLGPSKAYSDAARPSQAVRIPNNAKKKDAKAGLCCIG